MPVATILYKYRKTLTLKNNEGHLSWIDCTHCVSDSTPYSQLNVGDTVEWHLLKETSHWAIYRITVVMSKLADAVYEAD